MKRVRYMISVLAELPDDADVEKAGTEIQKQVILHTGCKATVANTYLKKDKPPIGKLMSRTIELEIDVPGLRLEKEDNEHWAFRYRDDQYDITRLIAVRQLQQLPFERWVEEGRKACNPAYTKGQTVERKR